MFWSYATRYEAHHLCIIQIIIRVICYDVFLSVKKYYYVFGKRFRQFRKVSKDFSRIFEIRQKLFDNPFNIPKVPEDFQKLS